MDWKTLPRVAITILMAGGLALAGVVTAGAQAAPTAEVTATPTDNPAVIDITASGFEADEVVSVWVTGPSEQVQALDQRDVGSDGDVSFEVFIPRHYQAGRWAITVQGLSSDLKAIDYFDNPGRGPNLELSVDQASGPAGSTFAFRGSDFREDEMVSFWATGPDGKALDGGSFMVTDSDGNVYFTFTVPVGAPAGQWEISAYGEDSDNLAVAAFTVTT